METNRTGGYGRWLVLGLGLYLVCLAGLLGYLLVKLWPAFGTNPNPQSSNLALFGIALNGVPLDTHLLLLVMVSGAIGSYIHAATSFADYVGNQRLTPSWLWWYLLRTMVGVSLAVLFYLVVRGGFLSAGAGANDVSPYGIAAVAGLVGMFSKQATDKLKEVFDVLFKTAPGGGDAKRQDKLSYPKPVISSVEPKVVDVNVPATVNVTGSGFVAESRAMVGNREVVPELVDDKNLKVPLSQEDTAQTGPLSLTVTNPSPGGGVSEPVELTVVRK